MSTPWGRIQQVDVYERGIAFVHTGSHGGVRVSPSYAKKHLSPLAIERGTRWGGSDTYLYYEEDCQWAIVAWELPHLWDKFFSYAHEKTAVQQREFLAGTLAHWEPEYAIQMGIIDLQNPPEIFCHGNHDSGQPLTGKPIVSVNGSKSIVCDICGETILDNVSTPLPFTRVTAKFRGTEHVGTTLPVNSRYAWAGTWHFGWESDNLPTQVAVDIHVENCKARSTVLEIPVAWDFGEIYFERADQLLEDDRANGTN